MNTTTAAVAASNDGSATAVAFSPQDLENTRVVQAFRDNNSALKFFRDTNEDRFARPTTHCVELTHRDPIPIGVIEHEKGTPRYSFSAQRQPWSWRQMLAGMTDEVKTKLLGDPREGVVRIWCAPIPGSYDPNRAAAWVKYGWTFGDDDEILLWDFFLERTDGITMRLHPHWKGLKVDVANGNDPPRWKPPRNGKGRKYKPGTHRSIMAANYSAGPAHGGAATPNGSEGGLDADIHGRDDADSHGCGVSASHPGGDSDSLSFFDCDDAASDTPSFGGKDTTAWATATAAPTQGSGRAQEVECFPEQHRAASHSFTPPPHGLSGAPNLHQGKWDKSCDGWTAARSLRSIPE